MRARGAGANVAPRKIGVPGGALNVRGTRFARRRSRKTRFERTRITPANEDGNDVARNPWRTRMRLAGVVAAGVLAGAVVGWILVELLIKR